jgi:hypothetical protein
MHSPHLIQELGRRLNLTGLSFTGGVCRLMFDRSLPIDIEDDGQGTLFFHTTLGLPPHGHREAFLGTLLSAHLFGMETDGAVFGLHPKSGELYLFRALRVDTLEVETTLQSLERFTQQAQNWRKRVAEISQELAQAAASPTTPAAGGFDNLRA